MLGKQFWVDATNGLLAKVGYKAIRHPKALQADPSKELVLSVMHAVGSLRLLPTSEDAVFRFFQIGALESKNHFAPVAAARMFSDYQGILVDAQPVAIEQLAQKYGDDRRLSIVHAVVTDTGEDAPFFYVDNHDGRFPRWVTGLASLDKRNILKFSNEFPDIQDHVVEAVVPGATIGSLLDQKEFGTLDLLMIDTEGYDYKLLQAFPFDRMRPKIVLLEHSHLKANLREEAIAMLLNLRYRVALLRDDILAVVEEVPAVI